MAPVKLWVSSALLFSSAALAAHDFAPKPHRMVKRRAGMDERQLPSGAQSEASSLTAPLSTTSAVSTTSPSSAPVTSASPTSSSATSTSETSTTATSTSSSQAPSSSSAETSTSSSTTSSTPTSTSTSTTSSSSSTTSSTPTTTSTTSSTSSLVAPSTLSIASTSSSSSSSSSSSKSATKSTVSVTVPGLVSTTKTSASASSSASGAAAKSSGLSKTALGLIIAACLIVGGGLIFFVVRKIMFAKSKRFNSRLQPLDFNNDMPDEHEFKATETIYGMNGEKLDETEHERRERERMDLVAGLDGQPDYPPYAHGTDVHDVPAHDFSAGPSTGYNGYPPVIDPYGYPPQPYHGDQHQYGGAYDEQQHYDGVQRAPSNSAGYGAGGGYGIAAAYGGVEEHVDPNGAGVHRALSGGAADYAADGGEYANGAEYGALGAEAYGQQADVHRQPSTGAGVAGYGVQRQPSTGAYPAHDPYAYYANQPQHYAHQPQQSGGPAY